MVGLRTNQSVDSQPKPTPWGSGGSGPRADTAGYREDGRRPPSAASRAGTPTDKINRLGKPGTMVSRPCSRRLASSVS
jgi:hypothetical protein